MSGNRFCADTNTIIYFLEGKESAIKLLDGTQLSVSIISKIELLSKATLKKTKLQ